MQVVEDEHNRRVEVLERVDQRGQDEVAVLTRLDLELGDGTAETRAAQRSEHAAPEAPPVAVERVQREPGGRARGPAGCPCAEQRALAGTGRRGNELSGSRATA